VAEAPDLPSIYMDLHSHPELAFQERRTAGIAAGWLRDLSYETTTGVGGTGIVGILRNGPGPVALLRADMDALPVREQTGLPYASTEVGTDADGETVPIMHACGHDVHVTCLLGAAAALAADRSSWQGTLQLVFQPAEEAGLGAQAMINDGLFDRFGRPDVVLGQHVAPIPAGVFGLRAGPAFAASDSVRIVLRGRGGHGSRPETTVDPVLMAAATVLRLQGIVSREVAASETAVLTVGMMRAGTRENIVPDEAELRLMIRTFDTAVRDRVVAAVERVVRAEAAASGAPADPEITVFESFPAVVKDAAAARRLTPVSAKGWCSTRGRSPGARTSGNWPPRRARRARTGCSVPPTRRCSQAPPVSPRSPRSWRACRRTIPLSSRRSSSRRWPPASPRSPAPHAPGSPLASASANGAPLPTSARRLPLTSL
jgi:amidohydrolase